MVSYGMVSMNNQRKHVSPSTAPFLPLPVNVSARLSISEAPVSIVPNLMTLSEVGYYAFVPFGY